MFDSINVCPQPMALIPYSSVFVELRATSFYLPSFCLKALAFNQLCGFAFSAFLLLDFPPSVPLFPFQPLFLNTIRKGFKAIKYFTDLLLYLPLFWAIFPCCLFSIIA